MRRQEITKDMDPLKLQVGSKLNTCEVTFIYMPHLKTEVH